MRSVRDALINEFGVAPSALDGWDLLSATAISADGSTIVGYGHPPGLSTTVREAWLARIATIVGGRPGDFNNDGVTDGADFVLWQRGDSLTPLGAQDLIEWEAHSGQIHTATVIQTAVPEPSTALLTALVSAAVVGGCSRPQFVKTLSQ